MNRDKLETKIYNSGIGQRVMVKWIYKLATEAQWEAALAAGQFAGAPVDLEDGYIHFSTAAQVQETARKYFRHTEKVLLLVVLVELLEEVAGPLKWEPARSGDFFPHLYGSMPLEAVIELFSLPLDQDGYHEFPPLPKD